MIRVTALVMVGALLALGPGAAGAYGAKQIKVVFESRQSSAQSREGAQGSGRVIIGQGSPRGSGRVEVESTQRTVSASTSVFTVVQDGGESMLLVASQVPSPQVAYYRDYLTGRGYVAAGVAFRDVGTSLKVAATALPGNQIRVRLTPTISWFAPDRSGIVEVTEATTELIVPNRRPVVIGGATTQLNELTRQVLGITSGQSRSDTLLSVTASLVE